MHDYYQPEAVGIDRTDGIGMEFQADGQQWRFNLRSSNTEPLVRLNVEAKGERGLIDQKVNEITGILTQE